MIEIEYRYPYQWQQVLDLGAGFDLRLGYVGFGVTVFGLGFDICYTWGNRD